MALFRQIQKKRRRFTASEGSEATVAITSNVWLMSDNYTTLTAPFTEMLQKKETKKFQLFIWPVWLKFSETMHSKGLGIPRSDGDHLSFQTCVERPRFKIATDHTTFKWLLNRPDLNDHLTKWVLKLKGFDFNITGKGLNTLVFTYRWIQCPM